MPGHAFPEWQECTGAKYYFSDFQALGWQSGNEISCTVVSLCNRESTAGTAEVWPSILSPKVCIDNV